MKLQYGRQFKDNHYLFDPVFTDEKSRGSEDKTVEACQCRCSVKTTLQRDELLSHSDILSQKNLDIAAVVTLLVTAGKATAVNMNDQRGCRTAGGNKNIEYIVAIGAVGNICGELGAEINR